MAGRTPFTPEEDEIILAKAEPDRVIAEQLGRPLNSIRDRRYKLTHREAMLEHQRTYREANREAYLEYQRAYREANREAKLERQRTYREANREAMLERGRAYREANREARRAAVRRIRRSKVEATANARVSGRYLPAEDLVVMRDDISLLEIALLLDRTYISVVGRRRKLQIANERNAA